MESQIVIDMPIVNGREIHPFVPTPLPNGKLRDWNTYISDMLSCYHISNAAIYDLDEQKLLASSDDFKLSDGELYDLAYGIYNPQELYTHGIHVSGVHYKCTLADGKFGVIGKRGLPAEGVSACRTYKLLIVATHSPKMKSQVCNETAMILGDFLLKKGF